MDKEAKNSLFAKQTQKAQTGTMKPGDQARPAPPAPARIFVQNAPVKASSGARPARIAEEPAKLLKVSAGDKTNWRAANRWEWPALLG